MNTEEVVELLHPWAPAGAAASDLLGELTREVAPEHPLFSNRCRAVARRVDGDDVLFATSGIDPRVYVVHLTWSGKRESPPLPTTIAFPSLGDWFAEQRRADA